jgi:Ca-activated chloride channel homolog
VDGVANIASDALLMDGSIVQCGLFAMRKRPRLSTLVRACACTGLCVIASRAAAQETAGLRVVSPSADTVATGTMTLRAAFDGDGGPAAVDSVAFSVDGEEVCVARRPQLECEWDAGETIAPRTVQALARLRGGGQAVAVVRTRDVGYVDASFVDIVLVNTVVTADGRFVKGLERNAFRLREDDRAVELSSFEPAGAPLELVLALDLSGSMKDALPDLRAAAKTFLAALGPQDHVTLLTFNDRITTAAARPAGADARTRALDGMHAGGSTALYDAIAQGLRLLDRQSGRRALVVFSDGEDQASRASLDQVRGALGESDATLFAVGLGRGTEVKALQRTLTDLAEASGGRAVFADDSRGLASPFAAILEDLSNQYVLGFAAKRDGQYHGLVVDVPGQRVRIRARTGYQAQKP